MTTDTHAEPTAGDDAATTHADDWDRRRVAQSIVNRSTLVAAGSGLIPAPVIDWAVFMGAQLNLMSRLSELYKVPYNKSLGWNVAISLITSALPFTSLSFAAASIIKSVPVLGTATGVVTLPLVSGAITYALGQVLVWHYEGGGTLLDLDSAKTREYFKKHYDEYTRQHS